MEISDFIALMSSFFQYENFFFSMPKSFFFHEFTYQVGTRVVELYVKCYIIEKIDVTPTNDTYFKTIF